MKQSLATIMKFMVKHVDTAQLALSGNITSINHPIYVTRVSVVGLTELPGLEPKPTSDELSEYITPNRGEESRGEEIRIEVVEEK